jgi:CheY-like chemotaxis protein
MMPAAAPGSAAPARSAPGRARMPAAGPEVALGTPILRANPNSAPLAHVLLVEDNFVNQRVAQFMLAKLGYQVDVAMNGRDAVERLASASYDIVLMDCQMPEMDGFEATRIIRDPNSAVIDHEVPVVAMTANAFPEDRARSIAAGMNDFLSKPVYQTTLSAMLEKWVKSRQRPLAAPPAPA